MASLTGKKKEKNNKEMSFAQKKQTLDKLADKVNTKAGKVVCGRIEKIPEILDKLSIKWWPTPSYGINKITGGGVPKGKVVLCTGDPDSGKLFAV